MLEFNKQLILAGALLFLIPLSHAADSDGNQKRENSPQPKKRPWDLPPGLERHAVLSKIKGNRQVAMRPTIPSDGINAGLVIAYGHVLQPPYRVDYEGDRLLINGVQIRPSLVLERERLQHPAPGLSDEMSQMVKRGEVLVAGARETYQRGKGKRPLELLQEDIRDILIKSSDTFVSVTWTRDDTVEVIYAISGIHYVVDLSKTPQRMSSKDLEGRINRARTATIQSIRTRLARGACLLFVSDEWEGQCPQQVQSRVNAIMQEKKLSREQRIEKMKSEVFEDYDVALDVVDNYDVAEWESKK